MYLAKTLTLRSLPEIGRRFGGRDHTTVLHAVRKIENLVGNDAALADEIELLKRQIAGVNGLPDRPRRISCGRCRSKGLCKAGAHFHSPLRDPCVRATLVILMNVRPTAHARFRMKVTVERAELLKSLGHVHRVVERRNTIPILSNVLLRAEVGRWTSRPPTSTSR